MPGDRNSPQTLCLGNFDRSMILTRAFVWQAAIAADAPAGPPPRMQTEFTDPQQPAFREVHGAPSRRDDPPDTVRALP